VKWSSNNNRSAIVIITFIVAVSLLTKCINKTGPEKNIVRNEAGQEFAGSSTCISCHKEIYEDNINTAHYHTSQIASKKNIRGSFSKEKNAVLYGEGVRVMMEKADSSFYQAEYNHDEEKIRRRFDVVVGSGKKAQTYLYWTGNRLLQLPVFYFTDRDRWANSPGYPGRVIFNRPITSRCLECHTTYARKTSAANIQPEQFSGREIIYGVDCERCHGPAAKHVQYEQQHPDDKSGNFIIKPRLFSRQQKLDMCAMCHAGSLNQIKPSFSFQAGDKLNDYFTYNTIATSAENLDVHGNQYGMLSLSKCFLSPELTCNSCHSSHKNETGQISLFSQRCMSCHRREHGSFCTQKNLPDSVLTQNCIDCHMPVRKSNTIVFLEENTGNQVAATMRSHLIRVYPDEAKEKLEKFIRNKK